MSSADWEFPKAPDNDDWLWWYPAQWVTNYDGDTIDVLVDLGRYNYARWRLRLYGVDTPELRGVSRIEGYAAKELVSKWLSDHERKALTLDGWLHNWPLMLRTSKDRSGKYGRLLATVYDRATGSNLNAELIDKFGWEAPASWR